MGRHDNHIKCVFDTGSSFIWVPGKECTTCHNPDNGKNRYWCDRDDKDCTIYEDEEAIRYGSGDMRGHLAKDYITLNNGLKFKQ